MIDDLERAFEPGLRPGVVKRRAKIKEAHRRHENERADQERRVPLARRREAEEWRGHDRRRQAQAVADAVGYFFATGLVPFRRREQFVDRFHSSDRT